MAIEMIEEFSMGTQIKVIGVGGGGGNAVEHMIEEGVQGVDFVCANTDAQALNRSGELPPRPATARTGLGADAQARKARTLRPRMVDRNPAKAIKGAHMLFITAGMGGGTGHRRRAGPPPGSRARWASCTVGVVTRRVLDFEVTRRLQGGWSRTCSPNSNQCSTR